MRTSLVVVAAALGLAHATTNMLSPYGAMSKRQAFDPDEQTGRGDTCVEAFGPGYIECRPESATETSLCINPDEGQSCCQNLCTLIRLGLSEALTEVLTLNRGLPGRLLLPRRRPVLPYRTSQSHSTYPFTCLPVHKH
jgi:hypothetical protein